MARIYLSPSTQDGNQYAGGGSGITDSEEYWCRKVCDVADDILRAAGHTVYVGGTISVGSNVADSNRRGVDAHVDVHTNAGGGSGTEAWYYTGSTKGKKLAEAVYKRVAAESNEPDRGVKHNTTFYATRATKAPATIIEMLFHDDPKEAEEMRRDYQKFGRALAQGLIDLYGGTVPKPKPPTTAPPAGMSSADVSVLCQVRPAKLAGLEAYLVKNSIYATGTAYNKQGIPFAVPINPDPFRTK